MLKKTILAALVALLCAGGLAWADAAQTQDKTSSGAKARVEKKRDELKANRVQRKAERKNRHEANKSDRAARRAEHKGLLRRLWPFGKHEEQASAPASQFGTMNFGSGNPRDTSGRQYGDTRFPKSKVRSLHPPKRDGMQFARRAPHKRSAVSQKNSVSGTTDKHTSRQISSHKNGQFRRETKRLHRRPSTGLNWHVPQKAKKTTPTYSHKDGFSQKR